MIIMDCAQENEVQSFSTNQNVMVLFKTDPGCDVSLIFVVACIFSDQ